ncbi:MAG: GNAT family N-acetyltransferase [Woeseiaceae bacterium]
MDNTGAAVKIRMASADDAAAILELYRDVAAIPGGLARLHSEIDMGYVGNFVNRSLDNGVVLVAENAAGQIIGEIHAYSPGLFCFSHVLSDLTIAVASNWQGSGIGRRLFQSLLDNVTEDRPDILRIELIARESNSNALRFYESLGFEREGRLAGRIRNVDGSLECDIPMGWCRAGAGVGPPYPPETLKKTG